jgi:hypothetical protein
VWNEFRNRNKKTKLNKWNHFVRVFLDWKLTFFGCAEWISQQKPKKKKLNQSHHSIFVVHPFHISQLPNREICGSLRLGDQVKTFYVFPLLGIPPPNVDARWSNFFWLILWILMSKFGIQPSLLRWKLGVSFSWEFDDVNVNVSWKSWTILSDDSSIYCRLFAMRDVDPDDMPLPQILKNLILSLDSCRRSCAPEEIRNWLYNIGGAVGDCPPLPTTFPSASSSPPHKLIPKCKDDLFERISKLIQKNYRVILSWTLVDAVPTPRRLDLLSPSNAQHQENLWTLTCVPRPRSSSRRGHLMGQSSSLGLIQKVRCILRVFTSKDDSEHK